MTITLLDLYNTAASQEWAMYDNDATVDSELEDSLVLALNKAVLEIFTSYNFPFRERMHLILTIPNVNAYELPQGIIKKNDSDEYCVKYNGTNLHYSPIMCEASQKFGVPEYFCINKNQIQIFPIPLEKGLITVDYYTLSIGENAEGNEIYKLSTITDKLTVPPYLEELLKEAIITRTMLNTIASETDENYSAYKKQADKAFKTLVKYSKGVVADKNVIL